MLQLFYLPDSTLIDHRGSPVENLTGDPNPDPLPLEDTPMITGITVITGGNNIPVVQSDRARVIGAGAGECDIGETRARAASVYRGHVARAPVIGDPDEYAKGLPLENGPISGSPVPVITGDLTGDLTGDPALFAPLPRSLWRKDIEDAGEAWRYYEEMTAAGYRVRLAGLLNPDRWEVTAPSNEPTPAPALPAGMARTFATFADAWRYWKGITGYACGLQRDQAAGCYQVAAPVFRIDTRKGAA